MAFTLPILGGFALGLVVRRAWQQHFAFAFRLNTGAGLAVVAFLAGWSFDGGAGSVVALAVILAAAAHRRGDGGRGCSGASPMARCCRSRCTATRASGPCR